ncbi:hypothetical protein SGLAM104S_09893 [Streptomyces glaucescens]
MLTVVGCSGGGTPNANETAVAPLNPNGVSGTITVLTNRTDLVQNGTMKKYAAQFNKTYPEVKVEVRGHDRLRGGGQDPDEHRELR